MTLYGPLAPFPAILAVAIPSEAILSPAAPSSRNVIVEIAPDGSTRLPPKLNPVSRCDPLKALA